MRGEVEQFSHVLGGTGSSIWRSWWGSSGERKSGGHKKKLANEEISHPTSRGAGVSRKKRQMLSELANDKFYGRE